MVSYGDVFGLSSNNLNGENPYMFSEFAARRAFVKDALKELVLLGLAKPTNTTEGILYQITESGKEFSRSLESGYALEYQTVARKAVQSVAGQSGSAVISRINKMSAMNLRRETAR